MLRLGYDQGPDLRTARSASPTHSKHAPEPSIGSSGVQQIGIFTSEGCRFYPLESNRDVLKQLCGRPRTLQGLADHGVYLYSADTASQSN